MNTFENPNDKANMVGSMEPKTEAHPLAAQAQGMRLFFESFSILTPMGKGIPRRSPNGAMIMDVARSLAVMCRPSSHRRIGEINPNRGVRSPIVSRTSL